MSLSSTKPPTPQPSLKNLKETARYISDMSLELRNLAKAHGLLALQGLLEVAYYEAFSAANQVELPPGELERLKALSSAGNH